MVGSRGRGSRSKSKGLESCDSFNSSFNESADGPLDGVEGGNDSSNINSIPSVEEQLEDNKSSSVIGDGYKEEEQNQHVESDMEKDVVTEFNEINVDRNENICTHKGTEEEGDGNSSSANLSVEENEQEPEEDEIPVKFGLDNSDACTAEEWKSSKVTTEGLPTNNEGFDAVNHGIVDNITDNLDNYEEPNNIIADEPIRTLSDREDEEPVKENAGHINEVNEVTGQVSRPKRKVIRKRLVKKKMVRRQGAAVHEELPLPLDENNAIDEACKVNRNEVTNNEVKTSDVNFASDEAGKADPKEHASNEEKAEVKPPVKVTKKGSRVKKKKAPQGHSGVAAAKDDQKLPTGNNEPGSKENFGIGESDAKNEVVEKSGARMSLLNKSKKKKAAKKALLKGDPEAINKPNPSKEGKPPPKRVDSMGMVFICSSETKKDCYRYKVFGLPAGKKDMVLKIYKGMRLFLFDVELRMMYGIYKAADPGGYNIEPRAFKSQYPSQVRFVTLEDCVPLAEERFKQVLKDNYYTKNKFNCQLNSKQVRNLCKLFHEASKKAKAKKVNGKNQRAAATSSSARRDKKRKRVEDSRGGASAASGQERSWRRAQEGSRHAPVVIDDRYRGRPVYKRETFMPSVAPVPLYQPLTAISPPRSRAYSYDRVVGVDTYRRDLALDHEPYGREIPVLDRDSYRREIPVLDNDPYRRNPDLDHSLYRRESVVGHRDVGLSSSRESRVPVERSHHEPYASYREVREPRFYNGPSYSTDTKRERYDYSSSRRYAEYYRPAAEDRPAPPLYRRY